ncbi:hypothetical protein N431DRAFT_408603 [Stipitochalara longipes BDJ]|nr:hypothetical protein N431DRAFT_408603 [Stipitochalara longipes BDJ]
MPAYTYQPIDSSQGEIRILTLPWDAKLTLGRTQFGPLTGTLTKILLPISTLPRAQRALRASQLPFFNALSYVWGDETKPQEILIDGKSIPITQNLYDGLRAIQKNSVGPARVWADALCICQDNTAERSAQIMLMREIYHSASEVAIWLGANSEDGRRAFKFIDDLTDAFETIDDPVDTEDVKAEDIFFNFFGRPVGAIARGSFRIAQGIDQISDLKTPAGLDSKAEILLDPDGEHSLHRIESGNPEWHPSARRLAKVKDEGDFFHIAGVISRIFTQNDWFSRMWVVQEVGVADSAHFLLGGMSMGWDNVFNVICYLHYTRGIPIRGIRRITGLQRIRGGWHERKRHPLQDLMRECRYRSATDPRDKIYSLLGLMGDNMNDLLRPDYSKSVGNVYSNITRHFISQSGSLDPICGWQTLGRNIDSTWELPSWAPDYTIDQENSPSPLVPIDRRPSIYAASGYDHRSKFQLSADSDHLIWRQLQTHGIYIDSVTRLSNPGTENETFGSKAARWLSTLISAQEFLKSLTKNVQTSLQVLGRTLSEYSSYHYSTNRAGLQFELLEKAEIFKDERILDAFINTLLLGRISSKERLIKGDIDQILDMELLASFSQSKENGHLDKICLAFEEGSRRRRLLVTEKGYIGSAPPTIDEGDIVCVLYGCSVPVILRKLQDQESYAFVGECYLDGFMDAEAIALHLRGDLNEQEFILV